MVGNQIVYCPACETTKDKSAGLFGLWKNGTGFGTASAKVLERENGDKMIYSFNCAITTAVIECSDQYGFIPGVDELVETPHSKLNWQRRVDIDLDMNFKLLVIDAPMGTGKTHMM